MRQLDLHLQHIAEQLIVPRCPAQSCRRLIPDIEADTVLQVPIVAPTCMPTHVHAAAPSHSSCARDRTGEG